jgi:hypothetical protein
MNSSSYNFKIAHQTYNRELDRLQAIRAVSPKEAVQIALGLLRASLTFILIATESVDRAQEVEGLIIQEIAEIKEAIKLAKEEMSA